MRTIVSLAIPLLFVASACGGGDGGYSSTAATPTPMLCTFPVESHRNFDAGHPTPTPPPAEPCPTPFFPTVTVAAPR